MDDKISLTDDDCIDAGHTLFLGVCTTILFVAFMLLLIGDNVVAMSP